MVGGIDRSKSSSEDFSVLDANSLSNGRGQGEEGSGVAGRVREARVVVWSWALGSERHEVSESSWTVEGWGTWAMARDRGRGDDRWVRVVGS